MSIVGVESERWKESVAGPLMQGKRNTRRDGHKHDICRN
jgi:hypothetical protein